MTRPSYKHAILRIVENDDCEDMLNGGVLSVTGSLVADLFGVTDEKVKKDIIRKHKQITGENGVN